MIIQFIYAWIFYTAFFPSYYHDRLICYVGANKMKWLPLTLDPPPSRPPVSKGGPHRERHRDHDRLHARGDRSDRGGDRGDKNERESGTGGGFRDGGAKDSSHSHRGDRDSYRDHYKGHFYRYGSGHDRDKDSRGDGNRDHRKGERYSNLPPRYSSQNQDYASADSSGGGGNGGYAGGGGFEGGGRVYGVGGRGRAGRGKNWRFPSGGQGQFYFE